jgi:hypothetical protein
MAVCHLSDAILVVTRARKMDVMKGMMRDEGRGERMGGESLGLCAMSLWLLLG